MPRIKVNGGAKLRAWAREVKRAKPVTVEIGYFPVSRYPDADRTPVAHVAVLHEFGLGDLPERAFFRGAIAAAEQPLRRALRKALRGQQLAHPLDLPPELAADLGEIMAGEITRSIEEWERPPNAPATRKRKGGNDERRANAETACPLQHPGASRLQAPGAADPAPRRTDDGCPLAGHLCVVSAITCDDGLSAGNGPVMAPASPPRGPDIGGG